MGADWRAEENLSKGLKKLKNHSLEKLRENSSFLVKLKQNVAES